MGASDSKLGRKLQDKDLTIMETYQLTGPIVSPLHERMRRDGGERGRERERKRCQVLSPIDPSVIDYDGVRR